RDRADVTERDVHCGDLRSVLSEGRAQHRHETGGVKALTLPASEEKAAEEQSKKAWVTLVSSCRFRLGVKLVRGLCPAFRLICIRTGVRHKAVPIGYSDFG